jgi:hypothetical protein
MDGENSVLYYLLLGTVQGSILSPVLYAIYISPLFDLEFLLTFADDSYIPRFNSSLELLIEDIKKTLESITKWLRDSGLSVNRSKTKVCTFHRRYERCATILIDAINIMSKNDINILSVKFETKLTSEKHVTETLLKAHKALNALRLIRRFFNTKELLKLQTSNYYSVLYYNCEEWMISSLKVRVQQSLLTALANALKMAYHYPKR